jgi:hypothetical protein
LDQAFFQYGVTFFRVQIFQVVLAMDADARQVRAIFDDFDRHEAPTVPAKKP